jgi:hypothetical protein
MPAPALSASAAPAASPVASALNPNPNPDPQLAKRPDNVPEQFWDTEKGSLKTDDLIAAYGPLAERVKAEDERLAAYPKSAAEIPFTIPDGVLGDGVKVALDENHPMLAPVRELIFNKKLDPALLGDLATLEVKRQLAEQEHFADARKKQMDALGPNATGRIDAVSRGLEAAVGPEYAKALMGGMFTAKQWEAGEAVIKAIIGQGAQPRSVNPRESQNPNHQTISDEEFNAMTPRQQLEWQRKQSN